jgi:hypothetical protein
MAAPQRPERTRKVNEREVNEREVNEREVNEREVNEREVNEREVNERKRARGQARINTPAPRRHRLLDGREVRERTTPHPDPDPASRKQIGPALVPWQELALRVQPSCHLSGVEVARGGRVGFELRKESGAEQQVGRVFRVQRVKSI